MVWTLAVTETISYGVMTYAVAVFLTPMRRDLHASLGALTGAISISIAVAGACAPLVGAWLDRHGPRGLMTVGSLLGGASVLAWANAHNLLELYGAFAGIGLASAAVLYEPAFATINAWFDQDRRSALLVLTVVAGFASTIFLPTAQGLSQALGWRQAVTSLAALVAVCAVPHLVILRRAPRAFEAASNQASTLGTLRDPEVRNALATRAVQWLTVAATSATVAVTVVVVYLVTYLRARGYSPGTSAVAAGMLGALSVTGRIVLTSLARRVGLGRLTAVMVANQAVGVALLAWMPKPAGLVLFILLFGAGFGVMTIARVALLGDYVPRSVFARISGFQGVIVNAGRVAAPLLAGAAITLTHSYGLMLAGDAACALLAAACLVAAERSIRRSKPVLTPPPVVRPTV